ncbi:MAG: dihydrodipicolinate synthase family protein [Chloroflexota bacterium]|nr:dihydrodipicolinate synthase family protein [Chloroflexota bacterium]
MPRAEWHDGRFDRLWVASLTPYKAGSFDVDEDALRRLLRYFLAPKNVAAGMAVIVNPEAGELFYLTRQEKRRNVEIALEESRGKAPLFAGVIDLRTEDVVRDAKEMAEMGVDGLFVMPPLGAIDITTSWNAQAYPEVWIDQVKAIAEEVDLPMIAHPVATPNIAYGNGFPLEATLRMCNEVPNMVGWKMTYNWDGARRIARGLRSLEAHVGILGAPAVYFHELAATGIFDGTVSGSYNYSLEPMLEHILAWRRNDLAEARRIWANGLAEMQEWVYSDYSRLHVRYKLCAWLRGLVAHPYMRPPMPRPRADEASIARRLLLGAGLDVVGDDVFRAGIADIESGRRFTVLREAPPRAAAAR